MQIRGMTRSRKYPRLRSAKRRVEPDEVRCRHRCFDPESPEDGKHRGTTTEEDAKGTKRAEGGFAEMRSDVIARVEMKYVGYDDDRGLYFVPLVG